MCIDKNILLKSFTLLEKVFKKKPQKTHNPLKGYFQWLEKANSEVSLLGKNIHASILDFVTLQPQTSVYVVKQHK